MYIFEEFEISLDQEIIFGRLTLLRQVLEPYYSLFLHEIK